MFCKCTCKIAFSSLCDTNNYLQTRSLKFPSIVGISTETFVDKLRVELDYYALKITF
jgi:hypothetical protein